MYVLLGRSKMFYANLLLSKRLPRSGSKSELQARLLRYVKRTDMRLIRQERTTLIRSAAVLLRVLPAGPASLIQSFLRDLSSQARYRVTFRYVFRPQATSFFARVRSGSSWGAPFPCFVVGQGVRHSSCGRIRCYATLVSIDSGTLYNAVDLRDVVLKKLRTSDWERLRDMRHLAELAASATEERNLVLEDLMRLECEEAVLAHACEVAAEEAQM